MSTLFDNIPNALTKKDLDELGLKNWIVLPDDNVLFKIVPEQSGFQWEGKDLLGNPVTLSVIKESAWVASNDRTRRKMIDDQSVN